MQTKIVTIIFFAGVFLTSCNQISKEPGKVNTDPLATITLSPKQAENIRVQLNKIETRVLHDHVQANGKLDVPPQNMAVVSAPVGGFVRWTSLLEGMKVKKGSVIARLENLDYVELQQAYLDAVSKMDLFENEYNRQVSLSRENVNAEKILQQAKSQFKSQKAIVNGLEAKLKLINISPSSVMEGNIISTINIIAPISGYVTEVNVTLGQLAQSSDVMFRIVNLEHVHAELYVYEKDISKISVDQQVRFQIPNDDSIRRATVFLIGKEISQDRTVRVHCHLDNEDPALIPGMYVTAEIEVGSSECNVVPDQALVSHNGQPFIFTEIKKNEYKPVPVKVNMSENGFTQIILPDGFDLTQPIVVMGSFELLGLMSNIQED